jgi:beta-lysine 5,6-aminomutase beta subunit
MEACAEGYTYFVVYGHSSHAVDLSAIDVPEVRTEALSRDEIEHRIQARLARKIVVVGACTGSDAHTVGIDAILNMKGYAGDKGLEAYPWFDAYNLGAQVDNAALLARAKELRADAVLVSQIMTQRDLHIENSQQLIELARKNGMRNLLFLLGGPRIDHKLARELGYDAGFGPGTKPSQVASYIVDTLIKRRHGGGER